jgi:hypothetical protein
MLLGLTAPQTTRPKKRSPQYGKSAEIQTEHHTPPTRTGAESDDGDERRHHHPPQQAMAHRSRQGTLRRHVVRPAPLSPLVSLPLPIRFIHPCESSGTSQRLGTYDAACMCTQMRRQLPAQSGIKIWGPGNGAPDCLCIL